MIKAAIAGADSKTAGEIIRLLIDHPDVELTTLLAPCLSGCRVSDVHHGLIGRRLPAFTDRLDIGNVDVVFIAAPSAAGDRLLADTSDKEKRVIALCSEICRRDSDTLPGVEYGLSEINRKPLVRGAVKAIIPTPPASLTLTALYPLATNLLLNSRFDLKIELPREVREEIEGEDVSSEISFRLTKAQSSFPGCVDITYSDSKSTRGMRLSVEIDCSLSLAEILKVYENHLDDHNFTFHVTHPVDIKEVEGTNRCIVSLSKPSDDRLLVEAVADARLRGGAGEAVHVMNLLFGLHERVGLNLKTSIY